MLEVGVWVLIVVLVFAFWDKIKVNLGLFLESIGVGFGFLIGTSLILGPILGLAFGGWWLYRHRPDLLINGFYGVVAIVFGLTALFYLVLSLFSAYHVMIETRKRGFRATWTEVFKDRSNGFWAYTYGAVLFVLIYVWAEPKIGLIISIGVCLFYSYLGHLRLCADANPKCKVLSWMPQDEPSHPD